CTGARAQCHSGKRLGGSDRLGVPGWSIASAADGYAAGDCGDAQSMSTTSGTPATLSLAGRLTSNLLRGPLFFFFTGFFGCISLAASCVEEDGRWQHNIARLWARMSLRSAGAPVTVIGRENFLPLAIYTSNHTSFMDTPVVFSSLPFQFRILAKQSLWKWPFIGWHLNRSGQIPVDEETGSGSIAGLNRAIKALKAGLPLFIFPEGGRTHDGRMRPFM